MTLRCPCCDLPIRLIASSASGAIDGQPFVMLICNACDLRLRRLPAKARARWLDAAERRVGKHPANYACKALDSDVEARLMVSLVADKATAPGAIASILEAQ